VVLDALHAHGGRPDVRTTLREHRVGGAGLGLHKLEPDLVADAEAVGQWIGLLLFRVEDRQAGGHRVLVERDERLPLGVPGPRHCQQRAAAGLVRAVGREVPSRTTFSGTSSVPGTR